MALSIDLTTYVISIPQADLTLVTGTLYELDTNAFRLELKDWEDSEVGITQPDTHVHNTQVTVAGVTFARTVEILSPYSVEFEDGQYSVRLVGSNNNIFDVENGILVQNQVQVIPTNSAGYIVVETGVSGLTPQESQALIDIADDQSTIQSDISTIQTNIGTINVNLGSVTSDISTIQTDITNIDGNITTIKTDISQIRNILNRQVARALGLMQENFSMDQQTYVDYQGQKLLTSARMRLYNDRSNVGTDNGVIATYRITSQWTGQENVLYDVKLQTTTTTSSSTTTT